MGKLCGTKLSRIAQFRTKSFANPIAIRHVTCQFPWCLEVRDSKSELAFNEEDVYVVQLKIRGYHIYKDIWEASIGERLSCKKEEYNVHDPY